MGERFPRCGIVVFCDRKLFDTGCVPIPRRVTHNPLAFHVVGVNYADNMLPMLRNTPKFRCPFNFYRVLEMNVTAAFLPEICFCALHNNHIFALQLRHGSVRQNRFTVPSASAASAAGTGLPPVRDQRHDDRSARRLLVEGRCGRRQGPAR